MTRFLLKTRYFILIPIIGLAIAAVFFLFLAALGSLACFWTSSLRAWKGMALQTVVSLFLRWSNLCIPS